jgi:hypothetical protein
MECFERTPTIPAPTWETRARDICSYEFRERPDQIVAARHLMIGATAGSAVSCQDSSAASASLRLKFVS